MVLLLSNHTGQRNRDEMHGKSTNSKDGISVFDVTRTTVLYSGEE